MTTLCAGGTKPQAADWPWHKGQLTCRALCGSPVPPVWCALVVQIGTAPSGSPMAKATAAGSSNCISSATSASTAPKRGGRNREKRVTDRRMAAILPDVAAARQDIPSQAIRRAIDPAAAAVEIRGLEDPDITSLSRRTTQRLRRPQTLFFSRRLWRRRLVFWGGAIVTGLIGAGFALAANRASLLFDRVIDFSPWIPLILTPVGFLASAIVCRRVFPGAQGSGIPQAIAARHVRDPVGRNRLLSLKLTAGKILLTLFGLACGASIGREGPTVQVGASIMLQAARLGGMGRERGLILAGSAAGVAAAFNTPLAGIVFAIEEMGRSYEHRTNGLILSTVILAGIASVALLGNYSYFGVTNAGIDMLRAWPAVLACGIGGGIGGACFSRIVLAGTKWIRAFVLRRPNRNTMLVAALAGLVVAVLGIASHGATYGTGYEQARGALEGLPLDWTYAPMKLLATLVSTLSGIPGGIFAPSLSVGAGLGGALVPFFPAIPAGVVVVLGMAGYFSGVVQAPITAFVIIVEMTADHDMVIPLMVASVIGFGTSRLISPQPLYHTLAEHFIETARAASAPDTEAEQPEEDL